MTLPPIDPGHPDDVIEEKTGHCWAEWVALIDAGPGRAAGHSAIASWVQSEHGVAGWWAQAVTVGYERLAGLRMAGQMPDGTFTISRSRVVALERDEIRRLLFDAREDLFSGFETVLRSKESAKSPRFGFARDGEQFGVVMFSLDPAPGGTRITVTHDKLESSADGEEWKTYWAQWLAALSEEA